MLSNKNYERRLMIAYIWHEPSQAITSCSERLINVPVAIAYADSTVSTAVIAQHAPIKMRKEMIISLIVMYGFEIRQILR